MIIAFVFLGALAGMVSGGIILLTSGSVWASVLAYSGTGSAVALYCCLAFLLASWSQERGTARDF